MGTPLVHYPKFEFIVKFKGKKRSSTSTHRMEKYFPGPLLVMDRRMDAFAVELMDEARESDDNVERFRRLLEKHGFHELDEDSKLYLLFYYRDEHDIYKTVWCHVIRLGKYETMKMLLPLTPLFAVSKENIPADCEWIGSHTWMQNFLRINKVRWNTESWKCTNQTEQSLDRAKLEILSELACTMFAAELFTFCMYRKHNPMRITIAKYFLEHFPKLVHIKLPQSENRLPFNLALASSVSSILELLQSVGAPLAKAFVGTDLNFAIDRGMWFHENHIMDMMKVTEIVCQKHAEQIREHRTSEQFTLLHTLFRTTLLAPLEDRISCCRLLLRTGVDPRRKDNRGRTVFDILLDAFLINLGRFAFWYHEGTFSIKETDKLKVNVFVECADSILPFMKSKVQRPMRLPTINYDSMYLKTDMAYKHIFYCFELLLERFTFTYSIGHPLALLVCSDIIWRNSDHYIFISKKTFDYPANAKLIYLALCKGLDLNERFEVCDSNVSLPGCFCSVFLSQRHYKVCRCAVGVGCNTSWAIMELMLHCGANLEQLLTEELTTDNNVTASLLSLLSSNESYGARMTIEGSPINTNVVNSLCLLIWMYAPSHKKYAINYLCSLPDEDKTSEVVELLQKTRPLTLLSRLSVLTYVKWVDIGLLGLPSCLEKYVRIGDISHKSVYESME